MSKIDDARRQAMINTTTPGIYDAGGQAMTPAQAERLRALSTVCGEDFDASLSEADAAVRIEQLEKRASQE